jgi:uncharacterized protein
MVDSSHNKDAVIMAIAPETLHKEEALKDILRGYGSIVIAYSGGVDSTYLADVAAETLGDAAHLVIADSPSLPRGELGGALRLARDRGWHIEVVQTTEFENEEYLRNDGMRCYFCKGQLFEMIERYAREHGVAFMAHGELADDALDTTRVGVRAARERGAVAPLAAAGLVKDEVRALSQLRHLPTWNKPSFACLSSRFPKGTRLNTEEVRRVEEAEEVLRAMGFRQYRARHHGDLCRIEIEPGDFARIIDPAVRTVVVQRLQALGYRHVSLDLVGYRTGSTA